MTLIAAMLALIMLICMASPVVGFLIAVALVGRQFLKTGRGFLAAFYGAQIAPYVLTRITGQEMGTLKSFGCWMSLIGPVLGGWFIFTGYEVRRRRKRKKRGLCLKCGYDLRASKDRCPECGEGIEKLQLAESSSADS